MRLPVSSFDTVQLVRVEGEAGQRLDNFLLRRLKGVPKSRIYRLVRRGEVRINRKRCKPDTRLEEGDEVRIPPVRVSLSTPPRAGDALLSQLRAAVLYEGDDYLVLNKPAGLSVHGGSGVKLGLIEALRQAEPRWSSLELAHRLDRETSGCLVIARTGAFLKAFHRAMRDKQVTKRYQALVHGYWPDSLREVDAPLVKNQLLSGERVVKASAEGKASLTRFRVLQHFGRTATLMEASPVTGRTHQIRVHCHVAGHPIVGDPKYGTRQEAGAVPTKSLCLHASEIRFRWPEASVEKVYSANLSSTFEEALNYLKSNSK